MTFKIFERKDKISGKGSPLIFIIQGKKIPTGYHCKPGSWNQLSQSVKTTGASRDPRAPQLNSKLLKARIELQRLIDKGLSIEDIREEYNKFIKSPSAEPAKQIIPQKLVTNVDYYETLSTKGKEFYLLVENIIHSHRADWSEGYKKRFRSLRTKILLFEPNFVPKMLTEEWWREFAAWCIETLENTSNTINTDTKVIEALKKELNVNLHEKLSWQYIEPEILGLDWEKILYLNSPTLIRKVKEHHVSTLNDSRIKWLAGAFTGRRWTEIHGIGPSNFYQKDGAWRYKNIGKGNKRIDIPLLEEAVEFFKSINFRVPPTPQQAVNRDIKTICRLADYKNKVLVLKPIKPGVVSKETVEEWETVHFHTGRHSYAQHIADLAAGKPHAEKFVSYMLGHASFQTTWKYMNRAASSNEQMFKEIFKST